MEHDEDAASSNNMPPQQQSGLELEDDEGEGEGSVKVTSPVLQTLGVPKSSGNLVHLHTEETSRCNLSILLNQKHILSRNMDLLPIIDPSMVASSSYSSCVPAVVAPGPSCVTGQAVFTVKGGLKAGGGGAVAAAAAAAAESVSPGSHNDKNDNGEGPSGERGGGGNRKCPNAAPLMVKSIKAVLYGVETIRLATSSPDDAADAAAGSSGPGGGVKGGASYVRKQRTFVRDEQYLVGGGASVKPFRFHPGASHSYAFSLSIPPHSPPSLDYAGSAVSVDYRVSVVAELGDEEGALRPTKGGVPVVKFLIVKRGGVRVRSSSRMNSKEVGWALEGSVVYIDQKEWFYNNSPDPERKHPNSGFWRVHIIDSGGGRYPMSGWITGKSSVIDPIQPSSSLSSSVPVLVGGCSLADDGGPWKGDGYGFDEKSSRAIVKLRRSRGGCCGVICPMGTAAGHVETSLKLKRTIFWKDGEGGGGRR